MEKEILHVLIGRGGDICIALPALKRHADQHGKPAALLTSAEFMPLLEGCSYVKATPWKGNFHQLPACLDFLKTDLPRVPVKCLQFYQSGGEKVLPSFWHEQMYLAGLLGGGEDEPLVFDRRRPDEESALIWEECGDDKRPVILVALNGNSSPFKQADDLWDVLEAEFNNEFHLIDLSQVKAEHPYDLLGLYDHAAALISVDTLHLHLSKASNVPVLALARDFPDRWHGTPQQDRFHWYCRYGQVMERADELVQTLRDLLLNKKSPKLEFLNLPKGAYNPSIIVHEGRELISYRHHPDRTWKTQLVLDGLPVRFPYPISQCAHEDMRLFHFHGKLWASYVCSRLKDAQPRCITGYGELVKAEGFWAIREHFQPNMPGNDWSGLCKNMVCWEHADRLYAQWENGTVIALEAGKVVQIFKHIPLMTWPYGEIRGGTCPLPCKDKWLRFFHSRVWDRENGKPWRYHIGALLMEPHPPFNVVKVSKKPILSGDESGDPMIWHWKPDVCICYGVVENPDGGWTVSLGINDAHGALLHLKEDDLNL